MHCSDGANLPPRGHFWGRAKLRLAQTGYDWITDLLSCWKERVSMIVRSEREFKQRCSLHQYMEQAGKYQMPTPETH